MFKPCRLQWIFKLARSTFSLFRPIPKSKFLWTTGTQMLRRKVLFDPAIWAVHKTRIRGESMCHLVSQFFLFLLNHTNGLISKEKNKFHDEIWTKNISDNNNVVSVCFVQQNPLVFVSWTSIQCHTSTRYVSLTHVQHTHTQYDDTMYQVPGALRMGHADQHNR